MEPLGRSGCGFESLSPPGTPTIITALILTARRVELEALPSTRAVVLDSRVGLSRERGGNSQPVVIAPREKPESARGTYCRRIDGRAVDGSGLKKGSCLEVIITSLLGLVEDPQYPQPPQATGDFPLELVVDPVSQHRGPDRGEYRDLVLAYIRIDGEG